MKKILLEALVHNFWFYALALIAIGIMITSFFLPPIGVISPSVLQGVAEIFAFAALGTVIKGIDKGLDTTIKHHDTELTIGDKDKND